MKKPAMIIGKKQIIMTCLTLMLAAAVYINYSTAPDIKGGDDTVSVADTDDTINYGDTEFVNAQPVKVIKKTVPNTSYQRLCASLDRLSALVKQSKGLTNKDLAKLTDSINNLCAKWED